MNYTMRMAATAKLIRLVKQYCEKNPGSRTLIFEKAIEIYSVPDSKIGTQGYIWGLTIPPTTDWPLVKVQWQTQPKPTNCLYALGNFDISIIRDMEEKADQATNILVSLG